MKVIVVTTITSIIDLDTMDSEHRMEINDRDGLSEVSSEVLGAVLMGGLNSCKQAVAERWPRVGASDKRVTDRQEDAVDIDDV